MAKKQAANSGNVIALALVYLGGFEAEIPCNSLVEGDEAVINALKDSGAVDTAQSAIDYFLSENPDFQPILIEAKRAAEIAEERATIVEGTTGDTAVVEEVVA